MRQRFLNIESIRTPGSFVSCGHHRADTCYDCPRGQGSNWCNGDCVWDDEQSICKNKGN